MSHFGRQSRSSLAPRAAWVIEGGHHRGGGPLCAAAARLRRRPRRRRRHPRRQHPALEVPCDHAFEHRCVRSCWQASRQDGRRREGDRFGLLELIGCVEWRLLPPLQTLQWECGSSHTPSLSPFGVPKARRRYTNLIVWLPPHVRPVAERYLLVCHPPTRLPGEGALLSLRVHEAFCGFGRVTCAWGPPGGQRSTA